MADKLTKGITKDRGLRIYAASTTETVQTAQTLHGLFPTPSAALGRVLTAGVLMGSMLKEDDGNITIQIKGGGAIGTIIVVAGSDGFVKGCVGNPKLDIPLRPDGKLNVGGAVGTDGFVNIIKDLKLKEPYVGYVPIQTGEIAEDLAYYYQQSEQTASAVGLGVLVNPDCSIKCAGGFIVQVMPDCPEETLSALEKRLETLPTFNVMQERGMDNSEIIRQILGEENTEILEESEVGYRCDCSTERMERAIVSLGRSEIQNMIDETGNAEIVCHFCNKAYHFNREQLIKLAEKCGRE